MRAVKFTLLILMAVSLSACSAFYPNWGAEAPQDAFSNDAAPIDDKDSSSIDQATASETSNQESVVPEEIDAEAGPEQAVLTKVDVEIYSAMVYEEEGILEVIAQGIGFVEDGGSCTLRFLSGETEKTMTVDAVSSSDYTQCSPIDLSLSDLPSGSGVVSVSYESTLHAGTSSPFSVVIP